MDMRREEESGLISAAQRVQNLSYVLALNPYHSAALASLTRAVEFVVSECMRRSIDGVLCPAIEVQNCLEQPIDRHNVNDVVVAAGRLLIEMRHWLETFAQVEPAGANRTEEK